MALIRIPSSVTAHCNQSRNSGVKYASSASNSPAFVGSPSSFSPRITSVFSCVSSSFSSSFGASNASLSQPPPPCLSHGQVIPLQVTSESSVYFMMSASLSSSYIGRSRNGH
ncbi:unnamed protein product [Gordionus sp. m RMFG-2023]